ncbi:MAG: proton-conducting transporter membrane subunit, partial [Candidatus Omnitrophota bacterium]
AMNRSLNDVLMIAGAVTMIVGVMMALVQHNMKRLLGYHAVSQVGYMVLGLGTGSAIGIAGGLFHMLNHVVYKACLFFVAGNVEHQAKTTELDELGGLARLMPVTYIACVIASLSISGVPPFNGFVSKWMIYQGLVDRLRIPSADRSITALCLMAALFASALTLASFMKLLHAVFLGQRRGWEKFHLKEAPALMLIPCVFLALICVVFGLGAVRGPLKHLIFPAISPSLPLRASDLTGAWSPVPATMLVGTGLLLGAVAFFLFRGRLSLRRDASYVGGEVAPILDENAVTGTDFYTTVQELGPLPKVYEAAAKGRFDLYEQGKKVFSFSRFLQYLHNGVLPTYLVWMLLGIAGLFLALLR